MPNIRNTNIIIVIGCVGLMLTALILQVYMELKPCPLCITQRIFVCLTGLIALMAVLHNPKRWGHRIYAVFGIISAGIGISVSLRHVWLQNLPKDQVPACGPDLSYMFENFPLSDAFRLLMQGDGNCADIVFQFLGLSIPSWTAIAFAGLIVINIWQLTRKNYIAC